MKQKNIESKKTNIDFKNELKEISKNYKEEIRKIKMVKKNKSNLDKINNFKENNENLKKANTPFLLKFSLIWCKYFAIIQSVFFIPLSWTIYFLNRYKKIYNLEVLENYNKILLNALIFYGIVPGVIMFCIKNKIKKSLKTN